MVICRIGSLEKNRGDEVPCSVVICRIGSLEICPLLTVAQSSVICRVGSLETVPHQWPGPVHVICRVGSLENWSCVKSGRNESLFGCGHWQKMAVVPDYVHDADQNCRRTGSKRILRRPQQIDTIHCLILLGMHMVFFRLLWRSRAVRTTIRILTGSRGHAIVNWNLFICRSGVADLIEKSGETPARSRRCNEERRCNMSLYPIGMGRRSEAMNPSQKNCLTDNHR